MALVHYRIAAAEGAGPKYPEGELRSVHQDEEAEDFTHWIDWGDGHFVVWPEHEGQVEIADQAIAYPLVRSSRVPVDPPAVPAPAAMPDGSRWKPCAAGFDDGRVLLVMLEAGLAIAVKRGKSPGVHMTEMSLDELRALLSRAGLAIVPASDVPSAEPEKGPCKP